MRKRDYMLLEGRSHRDYEYPDTLVAKHRLGYAPWVKEVSADIMGLKLKNTAKEKCGHAYMGGIIWRDSLRLALLLDHFIVNIRQGVDLKLLLDSKKVFDGNGKKLNPLEIEAINEEIFGLRAPWRGEHLDATFYNGKISYDHHLNKYLELIPGRAEDLKMGVAKYCRIDLLSCNEQGLPTKEGNDINYWYPRDSAVARFIAYSDWAGLDCLRDPQISDVALGVRLARKK